MQQTSRASNDSHSMRELEMDYRGNTLKEEWHSGRRVMRTGLWKKSPWECALEEEHIGSALEEGPYLCITCICYHHLKEAVIADMLHKSDLLLQKKQCRQVCDAEGPLTFELLVGLHLLVDLVTKSLVLNR